MKNPTVKRGARTAAVRTMAAMLLATTAFGASMAVATHAHAQAAASYEIPAGALADVLNQYARQAGVELAYRAELTANITSPGLKGSYGPVEGLSRILSGTGIAYRQTGPRAFTLEAMPRSGGAVQLGPVRVEGQGIAGAATSDHAATEGTGLYTGSETTTASRLPLTVKETPQSVTIVTRQRMEDFQLLTMQSVLMNTVGITENRSESDRGGYAARGFSITNMQIDGIASPFTGSAPSAIASGNLDTYLYDRIEVVRGATGLLSATGDPSATVNLVRKKPGTEFAAAGFASIGTRELYRGGFDVSVPISADGAIRSRLIGVYQRGDSFRDCASDERFLLSAMVEFDLTESTLLRVANVYQDSQTRGSTYGSLPRYLNDGSIVNLPRSTNLSTTWSRWNKTENRTDITLEQQIGEDWKFVAAAGRTRGISDPKAYFLGGGVPNPAGDGRTFFSLDSDGSRTQWTYDAHLNGSFDLFGRTHMLMLGVNGYRRTSREDYGGVAPLGPMDTNIFTFTGVVPGPARTGPRDQFWTDTEKMDGAFGSLRLSIADPFHVIVGGRVTDWRITQEFENTTTGDTTFAQNKPGKVFTPFFGATFDIIPELTLYASYADLFTPQTQRDIDNRIIDPIVGSNKEIGLKAAVLDQRLTINAAVYEAKRDNVAELVVPEVILPDGSSAYQSTGKGNKTRGYEIEVSGSITDRWNVYAGFSQNRTKTPLGVLTNTTTPQRTFKLQTTWRPPVVGDRLTIGGGVNWQSTAWQNVNVAGVGPVRIEQEEYVLVSLMARFDVTDGIAVSLNANNLLDKVYYTSASGGYYGEPRSVIATVNARF